MILHYYVLFVYTFSGRKGFRKEISGPSEEELSF